jgi:hypothetical protein
MIFPSSEPVRIPEDADPLLFVIVDTEEEFDWGAPFSRANTSVRAMRRIDRLQRILASREIQPTYVVDFPVASQPDGYLPLKAFADDGAARIGAHLHPWVNPPYDEEVSRRNSFGCNLGAALEAEKIRILTDQIGQSFGKRPVIYKAGRYGIGQSTAATLEQLGYDIDASVNPQMDYRDEEGPSFLAFDTRPFLFGRQRRLLEIPCSTDYTGVAGNSSQRLHRAISHRFLTRTRLVGIMARLGIVNKVMLSPEGSTLAEMKALTWALARRGVRTFSLTLHSPSVEPGCTPYVRSEADLGRFLDCIAAYCDFFRDTVGGMPSTPEDFLATTAVRPQERLA